MCSYQPISGRGLAVLATLLSLSVPTLVRAEPGNAAAAVSSPWDEEDREIEATPCSPEDRQRALELLAGSILLRSSDSLHPTPIVVQPPKTGTEPPKTTNPGGNPTPTHLPEPGSLLTGAVGSGLALLTWLRSRRKQKAAAE